MIGLFDSGLGGLSVYRQLKTVLPHVPVVYVADTKRAPYGGRSQTELHHFATQIIDFLQTQSVSHVVIGCNTISANCYPQLLEDYPQLPLFELIASAVTESITTSTRGIGYFATTASVNKGVFKHAVARQSDLPVYTVACPTFVPLVEAGDTHSHTTQQAVADYLLPIIDHIDSLVLGCTHYPFLSDTIRQLIEQHNKHITLIDPAQTALNQLPPLLYPTEKAPQPDVFYTTGETAMFNALAYQLIGSQVDSKPLTL